MASVLLIYPFFSPSHDRSIFRFPPLGISYIAAALRNAGHEVRVLDCTFLDRGEALAKADQAKADVVGIYIMMTMQPDARQFARRLRSRCRLLVAGGPLPSCDPAAFLDDFDVAVRGEGEQTMLDVLCAYEGKHDFNSIDGVAFRKSSNGAQDKEDIVLTNARPLAVNLDAISFPARDLLPNDQYIRSGRKRFGKATTSIMTTRGCPFHCEFCSNAVFGVSYRQRSPQNVVDEVEQALSLGYERIHFADDVFTLKRERLLKIMEEIKSRKIIFEWECLSRVDSIDLETARMMREAGCQRVFFGIESANESILKLMRKNINLDGARNAVSIARQAGIKTGAFFILGYPGETDDTVLQTIRFASSLPLDYLSFTMPYPLPGTDLFQRINGRMNKEWQPRDSIICEHELTFKSDFSESKLKFAILKGKTQFMMKRKLGRYASPVTKPFELLTDTAFRLMR